jgi:hypothetical protein
VNTTRHRLMVEVFGCLSRMYASNSCEAEAGGLTPGEEAADPSLPFPAMLGAVGGSKRASSRCLSSDQSPLAALQYLCRRQELSYREQEAGPRGLFQRYAAVCQELAGPCLGVEYSQHLWVPKINHV